jgi:hypothetical protein
LAGLLAKDKVKAMFKLTIKVTIDVAKIITALAGLVLAIAYAARYF